MKPISTKLFLDFFNSERSGGLVLIGCTILSLLIANNTFGEQYLHFWHTKLGFESNVFQLRYPIEFWVNDGLMTIFFVLVGLEIERELYIGELSSIKNALLPVFAAIGGMVAPALIHFTLNTGSGTQAGWGIPMATDIAFALGVLSFLGKKVPVSLKIFLTAFAIIDDLGAILVIAIFYTKEFSLFYFCLALAIWGFLFILNRLKVHQLIFYVIPGVALWYCMLQSGVHATISGILFAFALPFGNGDEKTCSYRLQHYLHKPVAFIILPLFALANTGIVFSSNWYQQVLSRNSIGILMGLIIGKPVGIFLSCYVAIRLKISQFTEGMNWKLTCGAGILGGIGFTMSIFITLLAFEQEGTIVNSKIAILISSLVSGVTGFLFLRFNTGNSDA